MEIHFLPVLVCAIISMVLGMIWYGPLFGKLWMRLSKMDPECMTDPVKKKEAQKRMMPMYLLQFLLSILEIWVLAKFITMGSASGLITALWIFVGFIIPMAAGGSMWNSDSKKDNWNRFLVSAGFNLVLFIIFGLILSVWR